jgi:hypothetical protein
MVINFGGHDVMDCPSSFSNPGANHHDAHVSARRVPIENLRGVERDDGKDQTTGRQRRRLVVTSNDAR